MRLYFCGAVATALVLSVTSSAFAQPGASSTLPLKRARLYETGVGYFERTGSIGSNGTGLTLPVPAGHLDDALKTLVVLSQNGEASVAGIEFGSSVSRQMALALAGLGSNGQNEPVSYARLLASLKGAAVQLRTAGQTHTGRLIDVLEPSKDDQGPCMPTATNGHGPPTEAAVLECYRRKSPTLLLLTTNSEIRRFHAADVDSVRPTDPAFKSRLGSALDVLSERGSQTRRQLRVMGSSNKPVTLGYIAETPIWRPTYRLVLVDGKDKGLMQGWALIHNDTDEDWQKVQVELVNGQPDSFLFPLAAPRYARRELVTPQNPLSTVPQLLDATVDGMWGDMIGESFGAGGLGLSGIGAGGGGRGEGIGLGTIGTIGHGAGSGDAPSSLLSIGNLANVAKAEGVESGALFRYRLQAAVDLRAHGSALLPFASDQVSVKRIATFSAPGEAARSAAHLHNDTQQTLPEGPIAVFASGGFAGESVLTRTKPRESRILRYGFDLDVELNENRHRRSEELRLVTFERGESLTEHFVRHHDIHYALANRSSSGRTVYLALRFVDNASVSGADGLEYDLEASQPFAVFDVAAQYAGVRKLQVDEGLRRSHDFDSLSSKQLRDLAKAKTLPTKQRDLLLTAAKHVGKIEALRRAMKNYKKQLTQVQEELASLRRSVRALGSRTDDATEALADRLFAGEARVKKLRLSIEKARETVRSHRNEAYRALLKLNEARVEEAG